MIHLHEFLDTYATSGKMLENPVLTFCMQDKQEIPSLFMGYCIDRLKQDYTITSIDLETTPFTNILSMLETSFLGMSSIYWLKNITQLDKKHKINLISYLNTYKGPHQVIIFSNENVATGIQIPTVVSWKHLTSLADFLNIKNKVLVLKYLKKVSEKYSTFSLDQACLVFSCLQVMGKSDPDVYIEKILGSENSLFKLSQLFFEKDSANFYLLWHRVCDEYPITFWSNFWSDQIWRAHYVFYYLEKQQYALAKTFSFKLPFTYIQRDWKKTTRQELKKAHQFIYEVDLSFKNNNETIASLDLFYMNFFLSNY